MRKAFVVAAALLLLTACGGDSGGSDETTEPAASSEPASSAPTGGDAAGSEAFCEATREIVALGRVDELPPEVDIMVREAPGEISEAAQTVGDAFHAAFENKDPSAIRTAEFEAAARQLREYAVDNCEDLRDITNE